MWHILNHTQTHNTEQSIAALGNLSEITFSHIYLYLTSQLVLLLQEKNQLPLIRLEAYTMLKDLGSF